MGGEGFSEAGGAPEPGSSGAGTKLAVGDVLGDCEILGIEGFGAMGAVYRARQRSLGRTVALKVIRDVFAGNAEYQQRFLREARLAASVDHPHVVSVFDAGEHSGRLYLTMQWVQGEDLGRVLYAAGRLSPGEAVTIVYQLAGALEAIHAAGLIHRDVKPANVVIRDVGGADHAYLTDFGLAKPTDGVDITQTGHVLGTPGFISPEQIEGGRPGPRSDLYALGCVAFELFTGQRPFRRENEVALLMAHAHGPRPRPSEIVAGLSTGCDEFFARALAIDPGERFATAREFREALRDAHAGGSSVGSAATAQPGHEPRDLPAQPDRALREPPTIRTAHRTRRRRRRWPVVLLSLLGAGALALALGDVLGGQPSQQRSGTAASVGNGAPPTGTAGVPAIQRTTRAVCGQGLIAGPRTSCAFAVNVALAYDRSPGGATNIAAYSPVTGLTYTMHCTGGEPHVCTGGRGASVTFRSGWVRCDRNISAGPNTSCSFAENVSVAYHRTLEAKGPEAAATTRAFSPRTRRTYTVTCTNGGATVTCTTTQGALISFPSR